MLRFLTALLDAIVKFFAPWREHHWKQQGRQETIKKINEALNDQIKQAEDAVSVPDPERDERLRNRFGQPGGSDE